jgi:hypothetical protein
MSQPPFSPSYAPVPPFAPQPARSPLPLWSLGIGIAALVLSWVPVLGLLLGLAAIVISAITLAKVVSKTKSTIGLVLGVVALIIKKRRPRSSSPPPRLPSSSRCRRSSRTPCGRPRATSSSARSPARD